MLTKIVKGKTNADKRSTKTVHDLRDDDVGRQVNVVERRSGVALQSVAFEHRALMTHPARLQISIFALG